MTALIESLEEGVLALDERGTVVRINERARVLLNVVAPLPVALDILPRDHALRAAIRHALSGQATPSREATLFDRTVTISAQLALGYPRWRTSLQIVLRTALGGIVTGVLVAVARVAGETAPLLFTAFGNQFWSTKVTQPIAALPLQIFTYAISPYDDWHAQAWAGALVLIALVLVISVIARFVTRRQHAGGHD